MLRKSFLSLTLAGLALLAFSNSANAQFSRLPGTGCPNAPFPTPVGTPGIGQGVGIVCPPCNRGEAPFVVLGLSGGLTLGPPITCVRGPCVLACRPIVVLNASAWRTLIPNDRTLIGACLCIQCGCFDRSRPCISLSGALRMCITR